MATCEKKLLLSFFALLTSWQWTTAAATAGSEKAKHEKRAAESRGEPEVLWEEPGDIVSRDLEYGPGGKEHAPGGSLVFEKEDLNGTSAKFVARDENGAKWKVKLGPEVHSETAASRIVWAAGYLADEDYFLPSIRVENLPPKLRRGQEDSIGQSLVINARLKRYVEGRKKIGDWRWRDNPFSGTRELNGLRVMMALINNWDLKDDNNAVYECNGRRIYLVSDLGASFGSNGRERTGEESKGNLKKYEQSAFISRNDKNEVSFATPGREALILALGVGEFSRRERMEWIGRAIPVEDARWIGGILAKLSQDQIRAAFRAAGFAPEEVDGYTRVLQSRIAQLNSLGH